MAFQWFRLPPGADGAGCYTIDPVNATGVSVPNYTIWSTVDDQSPGWGGSWYSVEGLGVRFNLDATTHQVNSLDWVLLAGYNGVEPGSSYTNLRNNNGYRADPTIRMDLNGDAIWDWALVVNAPAGISDNSRQGDWTGSTSLYAVGGDGAWRNGLEWDNPIYDGNYLLHDPRPTQLLTIPPTASAFGTGNVNHELALDTHPNTGESFTVTTHLPRPDTKLPVAASEV